MISVLFPCRPKNSSKLGCDAAKQGLMQSGPAAILQNDLHSGHSQKDRTIHVNKCRTTRLFRPFQTTGWSRKIETVKFGCIYNRGRIALKFFVCKISLIILQQKYPIALNIIQYTMDFQHISKVKVRPLCAMPHFLLKAL